MEIDPTAILIIGGLVLAVYSFFLDRKKKKDKKDMELGGELEEEDNGLDEVEKIKKLQRKRRW